MVFKAFRKRIYGFKASLEKHGRNSSKVSGVSKRDLPWRSITFRGRILSSASYLKIARERSALKRLRRHLKAGAA